MTRPPKKRRASPPKLPKTGTPESWSNVLLEEMRAQNRATIEAVQANRELLERKIEDLRRDHSLRFDVLEGVVRQNSADIKQNSADIKQNSADIKQNSADIKQNSADIRHLQQTVRAHSEQLSRLADTVERLGTLEERVEALERKTGSGSAS